MRPNDFTQQQTEVNQVLDIMNENVLHMVDRFDHFNGLNENSGKLNDQTRPFVNETVQSTNQKWWENSKTTIIVAILGMLFAVFLIVALSSTGEKKSEKISSTTISSIKDVPIIGGSMAIPNSDAVEIDSIKNVDNPKEKLLKDNDAAKLALKRVIRAIIHRQMSSETEEDDY